MDIYTYFVQYCIFHNVSIFNLKVTEIDDIKEKVISLENVFLPLWVTQCLSLPNLLVGNLSSVSQRTSCFLPPTFNVMESLKVSYILAINIFIENHRINEIICVLFRSVMLILPLNYDLPCNY